MQLRDLIVVALILVAGCAPTSDVTYSTITVNGKEYPFRTTTVNGPNGPYQVSGVKVRTQYHSCQPDSPGDCALVVQRAVDQRPGDK